MRLHLFEKFKLKVLPGNSTISKILDFLEITYKKYKSILEQRNNPITIQ